MDIEQYCEHACHCDCHTSPGTVLHFTNCCVTCPECSKRIRKRQMLEHEEQCHSFTMVDKT